MSNAFKFSVKLTRFDENYTPASNTRITTNFANLARGEFRQENIRRALAMINNRFNSLATADNPNADRYSLEVDIVTVEIDVEGKGKNFPIVETLKTTVIDHQESNKRIVGMIGNSFSSYVRDYDFSIVLPKLGATFKQLPKNFGDLHGHLYLKFINSQAYKAQFEKNPVICLSVSSTKTYFQTDHDHPILGIEYRNDDDSITDAYFAKMGLKVRYFMPHSSKAPLAFYYSGCLERDYNDFELMSAISTMETFQKIYRPEIYNSNSPAAMVYRPSLNASDYSLTRIDYDRVERSELGQKQGKWIELNFMQPYQHILQEWLSHDKTQSCH